MKEYYVVHKDNKEFDFDVEISFGSYEEALNYKNKKETPNDYNIWEVD